MATIGYGTTEGLIEYAVARGIRLSGNPSALMTRALDYIESRSFQGTKASASQPLQWPRKGVIIDTFDIAEDAIPDMPGGASVVRMQYATAIEISLGNDPLAPIPRAVKKRKVGPIETEFQDSASARVVTSSINNEGYKLLGVSAAGGSTFRVTNA